MYHAPADDVFHARPKGRQQDNEAPPPEGQNLPRSRDLFNYRDPGTQRATEGHRAF